MATEAQTKLAATRLKQWVELDKQVVTYRQIARELGVHVNVAKNILLEYYNSHQSLYATYHLSGALLPPGSQYVNSQGTDTNGHMIKHGESSRSQQPADDSMDVDEDGDDDGPMLATQKSWVTRAVEESEVKPEVVQRQGIVLAGAEAVESKQLMFFPDTLRIHIYSLAPGVIKDPAMYLVPSLNLRSHSAYHDPATYGTLTGSSFEASAPPAVTPMKDGNMDFGSSAKATTSKAAPASRKSSTDTKPETSTKTAKIKTEETITKNASTSSKKDGPASAMFTNTASSKPPDPATSGNKSGADPKLTGRGKAVRRIDSDEDEPEEERPQPVPAKSIPKTNTADNEMLAAMMDMPIDIDDDADVEDGASLNQQVKKSQKKAPAKKRPSVAQPQDTDVSADELASNPAASRSGRPRKRRRVTKTETMLDDKGYMVTKDVSGSESYSSAGEEVDIKEKAKAKPKPRKSDSATTTTVDAKPKPKPKAAPPPAKKGGKPGQQSSLMGFFTKKPS